MCAFEPICTYHLFDSSSNPQACINSVYTGKPEMGTLTNSEYTDKMPYPDVFHQSLQCLL